MKKRMFLFLLMILIGLYSATYSFAQGLIKGQIIDSSGMSIIGASVVEKGTKNGTITDIDGNFTFPSTFPNPTIIVSYIGYETQTIKTNNQNKLKITLNEDTQKLDEVVVTALGIKREKKALGYSVQDVSGDELARVRQSNVLNSLSGKVAGLQVSPSGTGEGGSTRVIIRGANSISGNNEPLIVVDGIPISNGSRGGADSTGGIDYGSGISDISPDDIESISILKGANAAALYGSLAANGVIMISTKKGNSREGKKIGITYSLNMLYSKPMTFPDFQNEYGRKTKINTNGEYAPSEYISSWGASHLDGRPVKIWTGETIPYSPQHNNVKDFFRTGLNMNHSISLEGGTDKTSARLSMSFNDIKSTIPNNSIKKYNFALNISSTLNKYTTINAKANYMLQDAFNRPNLTDSPDNPMYIFLRMPRDMRLADLKNYKDKEGYPILWDGVQINNSTQTSRNHSPYWSINENTNNDKRHRLIGMISANFKITSWLDLMLRAGTDFFMDTKESRVAQHTSYQNGQGSPSDTRSKYGINLGQSSTSNYDFLLSFKKDVNKFNLGATFGGNIMQAIGGLNLNGYGTELLLPNIYSLANAKTVTTGQGFSKKQVNSLYATAQIGYNSSLFLDLTGRNDWSSTLPSKNRSFFYPSVSLSAIFTDLFNIGWTPLSFLKGRVSWAQVGGDTSPYSLAYTYGTKQFMYDVIGASKPLTRPNNDLKPEITNSTELGVDARFFKSRLCIDLTLYQQGTKNQIIGLPVSSTSGFSSVITNAGKITNKGIEIMLSGTPIRNNEFEWNLNLNFAMNRSKIVKLAEDVPVYGLGGAGTVKIQAREGERYGDIVGSRYKRLPKGTSYIDEFGTEKVSDGTVKIIASSGLPEADKENNSSEFVLGNYNPDFTMGLMSTINWRGFDFSFLIDYNHGGEVYSLTNQILSNSGNAKWTMSGRDEWDSFYKEMINAGLNPSNVISDRGFLAEGVVAEKDGTYIVNQRHVSPEDYWNYIATSVDEEFVYDATFVKLREIRLGYTLPKKYLRKLPINRINLAFVANNLCFLYKNTPGFDPQSSFTSGNAQGIEFSSIPSSRYFGFNFTLGF